MNKLPIYTFSNGNFAYVLEFEKHGKFSLYQFAVGKGTSKKYLAQSESYTLISDYLFQNNLPLSLKDWDMIEDSTFGVANWYKFLIDNHLLTYLVVEGSQQL
jgi:hypothetical protein